MKRPIALLSVAAMMLLGLVGVTGPAQAKVLGPNGQIAFSRAVAPGSDDNVTFVANPDGTHMHQLLPGLHSERPHWSPNGTEIAVLSDGGLPCCTIAAIIVNPDTGTAERVLPMPDPTLFTACAVWSPDASRLACEGGSDSDPSRAGIYTIRSSDGGGLTRITSIPGGDDVPIDYSPDGTQIVFGRTDPNGPPGRNQALFVVNVNGSGLHRITPWGWSDDDGSWSPNGTEIVFEHFGALFTVHPDGTGRSKISLKTGSATTSFNAFDAGWSPDGTKLVFSHWVKGPAGTGQEGIATANADGSDVQMITTSPTRDHQADWGPHPLATS